MSREDGPRGSALAGVLTGHFMLGLAWLVVFLATAFLTSSYTGTGDLILLLAGLCWLVALPIIVIGWRSGSHWYWGVPVACVIAFALATLAVSAGCSSGFESGPPRPGTECPRPSARTQSGQPQAAGPSQGASLIAFESDRDGNPEIYVMNADGSDQRRLTRNETEDMEPTWSPDGTKIAFMRQCWYGNGRYDWDTEIFVMNADGGRQRNLTRKQSLNDESPAWSPDGTKIAFVSNRGSGDLGWSIFVMNADGSGQRVLARNTSRFAHPTWAPSGKQIAFVGVGDTTIWVMNSDGSGQRRLLTDAQADSEDPAWSPVASRIAFRRSFDNADDAIYTMNPDGSAQRQLTHEDAGAPAWAPNGTKIAFVSTRDGDTYDVYVMDADGNGQTRLTHNSATDTDPSWQPTPRRR